MSVESPSGRLPGLIPAALLLLLLITSCASGPTENVDREADAANKASVDEVVLPIDAYEFTNEQISQTEHAREVLISSCMRRFGFQVSHASGPAQDSRPVEELALDLGVHGNQRRYGVVDLAIASRYGYHLKSVAGTDNRRTRSTRDPGAANPDEFAVLTGATKDGREQLRYNHRPVPTGGCVGFATREIAGDGGLGEADLVSRIAAESYERSLVDPEVVAGFAKWVACMKAKGYDYASPRDAGIGFDIDSIPVTPRETAAAETDVACKQQTNLIDIWHGFEANYQNAQIARHLPELRKVQSARDAQMKRVADIIANQP
ncbi:hypothetical protein ACFP2T_35110 [Plantactinospora solaniradicis]|uniref:Uncharacterized protein n=1 Tax=Plantactinospora solaniradicis TaxID=1723736 RepID=A0ABW1KJV8_9ACTN